MLLNEHYRLADLAQTQVCLELKKQQQQQQQKTAKISLHNWVPEAFHARFPVSVKSYK